LNDSENSGPLTAGIAELDCGTDEQELFYKSARVNWSDRLRGALTVLRSDDSVTAENEVKEVA
jgi:hypothetical protein